MIEKREKIGIFYQPINDKEMTEKDIGIIAKYLSQMASNKELSEGMFNFKIYK